MLESNWVNWGAGQMGYFMYCIWGNSLYRGHLRAATRRLVPQETLGSRLLGRKNLVTERKFVLVDINETGECAAKCRGRCAFLSALLKPCFILLVRVWEAIKWI